MGGTGDALSIDETSYTGTALSDNLWHTLPVNRTHYIVNKLTSASSTEYFDPVNCVYHGRQTECLEPTLHCPYLKGMVFI